MFSREYYEIFKNSYFEVHLRMTASADFTDCSRVLIVDFEQVNAIWALSPSFNVSQLGRAISEIQQKPS